MEEYTQFLNFLSVNWGNLLSLLGVGLTIFFAAGAKSAAIAALHAAESTKSKMASIDLLGELNKVSSSLSELRVRVESGPVELIAERALNVRAMLSPIVLPHHYTVAAETRKSLAAMMEHMKAINEMANKCKGMGHTFNGESHAHVLDILDNQMVVLANAIQEAKSAIGDSNV